MILYFSNSTFPNFRPLRLSRMSTDSEYYVRTLHTSSFFFFFFFFFFLNDTFGGIFLINAGEELYFYKLHLVMKKLHFPVRKVHHIWGILDFILLSLSSSSSSLLLLLLLLLLSSSLSSLLFFLLLSSKLANCPVFSF